MESEKRDGSPLSQKKFLNFSGKIQGTAFYGTNLALYTDGKPIAKPSVDAGTGKPDVITARRLERRKNSWVSQGRRSVFCSQG
jgi:hypothetical protein